MYIDAHVHIKTASRSALFPREEVICSEIDFAFLNTVNPGDYSFFEDFALSAASSRISPSVDSVFFGIHPWEARCWAEAENGGGMDLLLEKTRTIPDRLRCGIGETGLDGGSAFRGTLEVQEKLFRSQLRLAIDLGLPVSIHCVRAWGRLLGILKEHQPLKIPAMLHSFYGPAEVMEQLTDYGLYISVSGLSLRNPERSVPVIRRIPADRLLVESDMLLEPGKSAPSGHLQTIINIYNTVASITGSDKDTLAERILDNGKVFQKQLPAGAGCC